MNAESMNAEIINAQPISNEEEIANEEIANAEKIANAEEITNERIRILKIEECGSLSGRSTLTYHVGCRQGGKVFLRVFANTGKGFFANEWVPMSAIHQLLEETSELNPLTSKSLHSLFSGKSVNTAGFVLAILKNEGLIQNTEKSLRSYEAKDATPFNNDLQVLIDAGVFLQVEQVSKEAKLTKDHAKETQDSAKRASMITGTKTGHHARKKSGIKKS